MNKRSDPAPAQQSTSSARPKTVNEPRIRLPDLNGPPATQRQAEAVGKFPIHNPLPELTQPQANLVLSARNYVESLIEMLPETRDLSPSARRGILVKTIAFVVDDAALSDRVAKWSKNSFRQGGPSGTSKIRKDAHRERIAGFMRSTIR